MGARFFLRGSSSDRLDAGTPSPTDPDPHLFKIVRHYPAGQACAVMIHYPNCTNYEGRKVMVYGCPLSAIRSAKVLDPHFTEGPLAPVARFEPTDRGWAMAMKLADELGGT